MERKRYIRVPKNRQAMEKYNYGIQEKEEMEEMILNEEQYMILEDFGVFDKINQKCDILIDDYEEEEIKLDKIPLALEVVNQIIKANRSVELLKLREMLNLAMHYKTMIEFDF